MYSRNNSRPVGVISVQHAALSNAQRYRPTVSVLAEAEYIEVDLSNDYHEFLEVVSNVNGTDGDSNVIQVYASRGKNDDYVHVATLTYTVGTMVYHGGTRLYHDSLTVVQVDGSFEATAYSTAGNDVVKCQLNTNGYRKFLFVASTLGSTDVRLDANGIDRRNIPS